MRTQSFRRVKIDINDKLYSQIIRFGKNRCEKCDKVKDLQCCHIIGRTAKTTRWTFYPKANAIALCSDCHDWFDSTRAVDILFNPQLQKIKQKDNRWWWLVNVHKGYSWDDLVMLYAKSQGVMNPPYEWQKKEITKNLRSILKKLEEAMSGKSSN